MINEPKLWSGASLKTVLEGQSIIDSAKLQVSSIEEAEAFLECYGFDYQQLDDRQEIEGIRQEAITFIEEVLLQEGEEIALEVRNQESVLKLLLWVSEPIATERTQWACALLRVMHTFSHCGSYFNERFHSQIQEQIFGRFEHHIRYTSNGTYIGDIELASYERKSSKTRHSAVLKLLHKAENVAADIFDWLGIRIVTRDPLDALKVLCYLREYNVVMFANIKPSRSRNTLIDVDWVEDRWRDMADLEAAKMEGDPIKYPDEVDRVTGNLFSGAKYRSLQFTCRQRVRLQEDDGARIRFYFPYEIQILDEASYQSNRNGEASHEQYKLRQVRSVRHRVMGTLCRKVTQDVAS